MNHKAIYKLYPNVVSVDDGAGAFDKDGNKVTDKNSPEMKAAFNEFNQKLTQLMKCFVTEQDLRTALSTVHNFKSFCDALTDLLPKDFSLNRNIKI